MISDLSDRINELEDEVRRWRATGKLAAALLLDAWGSSECFVTDKEREFIARLRCEDFKPRPKTEVPD